MRSPLKFAGGKSWLVPFVRRIWNRSRCLRLVEPFAGSAAISLGVEPAVAVLNDRNVHIANFWRWVQQGLVLDVPMANERDCYLRHREAYNALTRAGCLEQDSEGAQIFYYLNRATYNGLLRVNRRGELNMPFGSHQSLRLRESFADLQALLDGWKVQCGDFEAVVLEPADFLFIDPPYPGTFNGYTAEHFGWQDHERLARWASHHPGPVVATNAFTEQTTKLYRDLGFRVWYQPLRRTISAKERNMAVEAVFTKNLRSLVVP